MSEAESRAKHASIHIWLLGAILLLVLYTLSIRGVYYIEEKSWYGENPESTFNISLRKVTDSYGLPSEFLRQHSDTYEKFMYWYTGRARIELKY